MKGKDIYNRIKSKCNSLNNMLTYISSGILSKDEIKALMIYLGLSNKKGRVDFYRSLLIKTCIKQLS